MYSTSQAFKDAVVDSHTAVSSVVILGPDGLPLPIPLYVTGGKVSADGTAAFRRTCNLSLVDPTGALIPQSGTGIGQLAPYGVEIMVSRGIVLPTGPELTPLGVFRVSTNGVQESDSASRTLSVMAYDRSRTIARNKLTVEWVIAAGTNYVTAILALLSSRWTNQATLQIRATPTTMVTPLLILEVGSDPWAKATEMAVAIGYEVFFDSRGSLVLQPVASQIGPAIATYSEGPNSVLLDLSASLDDEEGFNGVIMTGESTTIAVPVRGEAWDNDPTSPTYYLGPYGKVPAFETSPYVVTQLAANAAAKAKLQTYLGCSQQVGFSIVPNPAHEPGDILAITRLASGVAADYRLLSFDVPLVANESMPMTLASRRALLWSTPPAEEVIIT